MRCKNKLRRKFDRAALSYDYASEVQQRAAITLARMVSESCQSAKDIVDLGCGTGNSTCCLFDVLDCSKIIAVDFSMKSLLLARKKLKDKKVLFTLADFDNSLFLPSSIDLAFSNMSIYWSSNLEKTLKNIFCFLRKKSYVAFSIPLIGTFEELNLHCRHSFFSFDYICQKLEILGFRLLDSACHRFVECFQSRFAALTSLKLAGVNVSPLTAKRSGLYTLDSLNTLFNQDCAPALTYHLGFFVAQREVP